MKVEILGDGCAKCKALQDKVHQAIDELGVHAEVTAVMDPLRLADLGARSLPQLAVNGRIIPSADLSSVAGVKKVLIDPAAQR